MKLSPQRGVALVITLIMLSVITVIAVAFLAVSRRERTAVSHSVNYIDAEMAMNTALERAKAEIIANIIGTTNLLGPGFTVAVNVDGSVDFNGPIAKYDRATIALLTNDARVPVFVKTNRSNLEPTEFRYYLDLNRNARPDPNGLFPELDESGQMIKDTSGTIISNYMVGDPEWLGILLDPLDAHGRYNRFGGRYTYAIMPAGKTLDLNFMHNHAKRFGNGAEQGFYRNQGVGTYEMNLAAFLADLNTNLWNSYEYRPNPLFPSTGLAFEDATELLNYRYGGSFASLPTALDLFAAPLAPAPQLSEVFAIDLIDFFADGSDGSGGAIGALPALFPPGASKPWPSSRYPTNDNDQVDKPWPGAESRVPNRFYGISDFWNKDTRPPYANFVARLGMAATNLNLSTYNQNTFYRLVSQLGTESIPEQEILEDPTAPQGATKPRININYRNVDLSVTNLEPWTPLDLFSRIASRLLGEEFNLSSTNIPVYANFSTLNTNTGFPLYNARVQQILQIAANVVEATHGAKTNENYPYYPHIYQPLFTRKGQDISIRGYEEVALDFRARVKGNTIKPYPLEDPARWPTGSGDLDNNVLFFGIPLIVGARKGFPNFNECSLQTAIQTSRKLQFVKTPSTLESKPRETNVMFIIGVSNSFGIEAWNSYSTPYPRAVELLNIVQTESQLTNSVTRFGVLATVTNNYGPTSRLIDRVRPALWPAAWTPGENSGSEPHKESFWLPSLYQQLVQIDAVYYQSPTPHFEALSFSNRFESVSASVTNRWGIAITNRMVLFMFDEVNGQLFDAVSLSGLNSGLDITAALSKPADGSSASASGDDYTRRNYEIWNPGAYGNISYGILEQINTSMDGVAEWNSFGGQDPTTTIGNSKEDSIKFFTYFLNPALGILLYRTNPPPIWTMYNAPFVPIRKLYVTTSWHANDPLVHYSLNDLRESASPGQVSQGFKWYESVVLTNTYIAGSSSTLGGLNTRYRPWAYDTKLGLSTVNSNDMRLTVKDSNVRRSDDWDFPTNKFPNIGWLGRVHRGTPWQTLYFKSPLSTDTNEVFTEKAWQDQVLMSFMKITDFDRHITNALVTAPTNDWRLLDSLTAALHPNASRGRLSVNQDQLAAWSAVLSGVPVTALVVNSGGQSTPVDRVIEPALIESSLREMVDGINLARAVEPDGQFHSIGDILNAPQLTIDSPYLAARKTIAPKDSPLYDADYERIPQQIMSLLKVGDARFVIYAFGQSLKPAPNSILNSAPDFGMCTNYQVTAEAASRTVVRVDYPVLSTDVTSPDFQKPNVKKPHLVIESYNLIPMD